VVEHFIGNEEVVSSILTGSTTRGTQGVASPLSGRNAQEASMNILWTIIIGFVAGVIAKFIHPGPNEPAGFILTTLLGIAGAFVATYLGQQLGWYRPGEGAGLIGAVVGALIVLVVWGLFAKRDPRPL
jgi:uncharacterized membrane protein YeaQ/YmgE (transglycosylase-associated protein family)